MSFPFPHHIKNKKAEVMIEIIGLCLNTATLILLAIISYFLNREVKSAKKQMEKDERIIKNLTKVLKEERRKNI